MNGPFQLVLGIVAPLLPVPPLDGYGAIAPFLPRGLRLVLDRHVSPCRDDRRAARARRAGTAEVSDFRVVRTTRTGAIVWQSGVVTLCHCAIRVKRVHGGLAAAPRQEVTRADVFPFLEEHPRAAVGQLLHVMREVGTIRRARRSAGQRNQGNL
jgi:hypothetical protein